LEKVAVAEMQEKLIKKANKTLDEAELNINNLKVRNNP
jgi:hypothetical protein